jgi:hypothetical protein
MNTMHRPDGAKRTQAYRRALRREKRRRAVAGQDALPSALAAHIRASMEMELELPSLFDAVLPGGGRG